MSEPSPDAIIVGAGIAGLSCARELLAGGLNCVIYEASDQPGGRIASDDVDGFILDRGFQVFLTAYPDAKRFLDYESLDLRRFSPGALVRWQGKFHRFSDPWRCPQQAWATVTSPVGSFLDKLRIARFRRSTTAGDLDQLYSRPEISTSELLEQRGFSPSVIERFFRPFLGGVFLDSELSTSSRMCEFVFRMFAQGDATLPSNGMRAIPYQLAEKLPTGILKTSTPVDSIESGVVRLVSGKQQSARAIIMATDESSAANLVGNQDTKKGRQTACLYFAAQRSPIDEPILLLNGDGTGPINNVCVPSQVVASYAPNGESLISVTVLEWSNIETLVDEVRQQLSNWFGEQVSSWSHLRTYVIDYALPNQTPPHLSPVAKPARLSTGLYQCGDFCDTGSINGAMVSGTRAAQAVLEDLKS